MNNMLPQEREDEVSNHFTTASPKYLDASSRQIQEIEDYS